VLIGKCDLLSFFIMYVEKVYFGGRWFFNVTLYIELNVRLSVGGGGRGLAEVWVSLKG